MQLQEALSAAIEYEHRVRDHYAKCAGLVADAQGKRVFEVLAREEQGHVDYLESRLGEWKQSGRLGDMALESLLPPPAWIEKAAARMAAHAPQVNNEAFKQELDFLKEALELERTTSAFYESLLLQLEPPHRAFFARFMEIEHGHVSLVQAEIDSLVGHGHWFDFMEFSLEK